MCLTTFIKETLSRTRLNFLQLAKKLFFCIRYLPFPRSIALLCNSKKPSTDYRAELKITQWAILANEPAGAELNFHFNQKSLNEFLIINLTNQNIKFPFYQKHT